MDLRTFTAAFSQIAEEKGIPREKVLETVEMALAAAYKRDYAKRSQQIRVALDPEKGTMRVWQVLLVVDPEQVIIPEEGEETGEEGVLGAAEKPHEQELSAAAKAEEQKKSSLPAVEGKVEPAAAEAAGEAAEEKIRFNPDRHIFIADARKEQQEIQVGGELLIPLEPHDEFGRIAAQTAKQVIIQRLREAERDAIYADFSQKVGEIVSGIVQRVENRTVFVELGRATGYLFPQDQIPHEFVPVGRRTRFYVSEVNIGPKGPQVILSRSHPKFVSKLFEIEVPEVAAGSVVIKAVAREAGSRTKIAVQSVAQGVDPIGACVGQRGTRVMTVIGELGGEKIDVIQWDEDPATFITHALSPAKVIGVELTTRTTAVVKVPDDQLSLAIGKEGQNVRLAAKLTGWKIDIRGESGPKPPAREGGGGEESLSHEQNAEAGLPERPELSGLAGDAGAHNEDAAREEKETVRENVAEEAQEASAEKVAEEKAAAGVDEEKVQEQEPVAAESEKSLPLGSEKEQESDASHNAVSEDPSKTKKRKKKN